MVLLQVDSDARFCGAALRTASVASCPGIAHSEIIRGDCHARRSPSCQFLNRSAAVTGQGSGSLDALAPESVEATQHSSTMEQ